VPTRPPPEKDEVWREASLPLVPAKRVWDASEEAAAAEAETAPWKPPARAQKAQERAQGVSAQAPPPEPASELPVGGTKAGKKPSPAGGAAPIPARPAQESAPVSQKPFPPPQCKRPRCWRPS
jgi:hypothetical protein